MFCLSAIITTQGKRNARLIPGFCRGSDCSVQGVALSQMTRHSRFSYNLSPPLKTKSKRAVWLFEFFPLPCGVLLEERIIDNLIYQKPAGKECSRRNLLDNFQVEPGTLNINPDERRENPWDVAFFALSHPSIYQLCLFYSL